MNARPRFPDSRGRWRDPFNLSRELREARGSGEFALVTSHVFRKTCATLLDEKRTLRPPDRRPTRPREGVHDPGQLPGTSPHQPPHRRHPRPSPRPHSGVVPAPDPSSVRQRRNENRKSFASRSSTLRGSGWIRPGQDHQQHRSERSGLTSRTTSAPYGAPAGSNYVLWSAGSADPDWPCSQLASCRRERTPTFE